MRESGYLVKNPSIFLKKVAFIRKYEIRDGISVPRQVQSVADVRFVAVYDVIHRFYVVGRSRMPDGFVASHSHCGHIVWRGISVSILCDLSSRK